MHRTEAPNFPTDWAKEGSAGVAVSVYFTLNQGDPSFMGSPQVLNSLPNLHRSTDALPGKIPAWLNQNLGIDASDSRTVGTRKSSVGTPGSSWSQLQGTSNYKMKSVAFSFEKRISCQFSSSFLENADLLAQCRVGVQRPPLWCGSFVKG